METSRMLVLLSLALLVLALLIAAGVIAHAQQRKDRINGVVQAALDRQGTAASSSTLNAGFEAPIQYGDSGEKLPLHWLNSSFGKALVADEDRALLGQSGWGSSRGQLYFLIARCAAALLLPVVAAFVLSNGKYFFLSLCLAFVLGFLLPKWVLRSMAKRKKACVARELPLLVDLLGLLQGTGMSLDQTLQVIAADFGNVMPVLSKEVNMVNQQYSHGSTRERSFIRMSEIYQNENLANLTALLLQIDRHGGAVQEPLKVFGERLREQRKARMKEMIGKISVKMTGVMVVTLLPALIIVTAGPGFLAVIRALGGMSR